jgi:putative transposase
MFQTIEGYVLKLVAQVKLETNKGMFDSLLKTVKSANAAANYLSDFAWENKIFRQYDLHRSKYLETKETFGLSAQATVRTISKVSDAYKLDKKSKRKFKSTGSIAYDSRILSWKMKDSTVSIWTVDGRLRIPFVCGERQLKLLECRKGEADLVLSDKTFYLLQVCEIPEPPEFEPKGFLGIDLGIVNIAVTSDGETFSDEAVDRVREKTTKLKRDLQKRGSKNSAKHLKRLSGREARFKKNTNHIMSKKIVSLAKDTCRGIAIEDLKGFNGRRTVSKSQRERFGKWAFGQLRDFLTYKAKLSGVRLVTVNPRNTSRTCSCCGHVSKKNRKSQSLFSCISCGHSENADLNAAKNIALRALVNAPIAVHADAQILPLLELQASDFSQG